MSELVPQEAVDAAHWHANEAVSTGRSPCPSCGLPDEAVNLAADAALEAAAPLVIAAELERLVRVIDQFCKHDEHDALCYCSDAAAIVYNRARKLRSEIGGPDAQ